MAKIIEQSVTLPAPADKLFDMYLDPVKHGAITGSSVTISGESESEFVAFEGMIRGKTLYVIPKRMIVQLWRADHWKPEDIDSVLILTFRDEGEQGIIDLVHVNVAEDDYEGVNEGWRQYYWEPWKKYLEK